MNQWFYHKKTGWIQCISLLVFLSLTVVLLSGGGHRTDLSAEEKHTEEGTAPETEGTHSQEESAAEQTGSQGAQTSQNSQGEGPAPDESMKQESENIQPKDSAPQDGAEGDTGQEQREESEASVQESTPVSGGNESTGPKPEKTVEDWLAEMTLEEKVGQMFIARCPAKDAVQKAAEYHLGGYILFARDFKEQTPVSVAETIKKYQAAAKIPMFIGVDEEGGLVTRVSKYPAFRTASFPSPQELYQAGGFTALRLDALEKCRLLQGLGINVNFAPVCDVSENPADFIYKRTLGRNAELTARFVQTVVEVCQERGIGTVLKHFPGYGNNVDTHTGIAYDERPYETFTASEFLPFQAGIQAGASMVLVSHNIVTSMDGQYPASLSPRVHEILRKDLGFEGVIVTDDLAMSGVRDLFGDARAAVLAVQAGNDLLCSTNYEVQVAAVLDAVKQGEISMEQIDAAVRRILHSKQSLGLWQAYF